MVKLNNQNVGNVVVALRYSVQFLEKPSFFTGLNHKTKYAFNINNQDLKSLHSRIVTIGAQVTGEDSLR